MAAVCAICLRDIPRGVRFVLAGTEVFHPACVKQRGLGASIGTQTKLELARTAARERENAELMQSAADDLSNATDRLRKANEEIRLLSSVKSQQSVDLENLRAIERSLRRNNEDLRRDLERAQVERDQAQRELAVARQYGPEPKSAEPAERERARDDTEIRFSLLELDSD